MIIMQLSYGDFQHQFKLHSRENQFPLGLRALFDHICENHDQGHPYELDVIELCCDYAELSIKDALEDTECETYRDLENSHHVIIPIDEDNILIS